MSRFVRSRFSGSRRWCDSTFSRRHRQYLVPMKREIAAERDGSQPAGESFAWRDRGEADTEHCSNCVEIQTSLNVNNCCPTATDCATCLPSVFQRLAGFTWHAHIAAVLTPLLAALCTNTHKLLVLQATCVVRSIAPRATDHCIRRR